MRSKRLQLINLRAPPLEEDFPLSRWTTPSMRALKKLASQKVLELCYVL